MNDWNDRGRGGDPWDLEEKPRSTAQAGPTAPEEPGSLGAGVLGAVLGAAVGALPTLATGYFGFVSGWLALLIPFAARKGYQFLHGARREGAAFAAVLLSSLAVSTATSIFLTYPYGFMAGPIFFLLPILFSFFGALACRRGLQNYVNPKALEDMTQRARQENREVGGTGELYTADQRWLRPLKASVLLSMFPELALALLLLALAAPADSLPLIFASLGAMLAVFVVIFALILPVLGYLQPAGTVFIRTGDGKLWRVLLPQLNSNDTYRFTTKSGAFRVLSWERLDEGERERAKANIRRAMADIEGGTVFPGSLLSMTVTPMDGMTVRKESKWRWRVRYLDSRGRWKNASVPKAYPGLSLTPGQPGLSGPVPFHWGLVLSAAAVTVALALGGAALSVAVDGPAQPVQRTRAEVHIQTEI